MSLPIHPVYPPMEAQSVDNFPQGAEWQYEPKWDGFRCIAFRDGDEIQLQSKAGKPLARYFPDVVEGLRALSAKQFVIDGELVVPEDDGLSFEELQLRLHPAESRVRKLAAAHPAKLVAFDMLVTEKGKLIADESLDKRRRQLKAFAAKHAGKNETVLLSPAAKDLKQAKHWFESTHGGLDGVIAKRIDAGYQSGERSEIMQKIKNIRSADCVVGGFRYATKGERVGSLLLGLYDEAGLLHHVGYTSSFDARERKELTKKLEQMSLQKGVLSGFSGSAPGGPSRWSTERSSEWTALPIKLVAEVSYDHFSGGRFRHGTKFLRWRPDKTPVQCGFDQIPKSGRGTLALAG